MNLALQYICLPEKRNHLFKGRSDSIVEERQLRWAAYPLSILK
jgi:hypothetical protein